MQSVTVSGSGASSTHSSVVEAQVAPLLGVSNVQDLVAGVDTVHRNLSSLGVYDSVSVTLDEAQNNPLWGAFGSSARSTLDVAALVHLVQAKKFVARTGTDVGNGEGSGYLNFTLKNTLGRAEIISFDASLGSRTRSSYVGSVKAPVAGLLRPGWFAEVAGYKTSRKIDWASHELVLRGANAKLKTYNQEFGLEQVLRTVNVDRDNASPSVRAAAGNDVKSSVFHAWAYDSRDLPGMPSAGNYFKLSHELAGLFGVGRRFYKAAVETQHAYKPEFARDNLSFVASTRGGLLWMLEDSGRASHLADRFYLGGPNDIRGFYQNAMGPRDRGDSVGGDCMFGASLGVLSRLPRVPKDVNLRAQLFVAAGSVLPLDRSNVAGTLRTLVLEPSVSTGIGIAYLHQIARFELNLTMPLVARRFEGTRKGLQFGVGISFM